MAQGVTLGQAVLELTTDSSKFNAGLESAARQSESTFSRIAKTAAATATGILVYKGLGAAMSAIKDSIGGLAAGFEQQLNILQAVSGASTSQMGQLSAMAKALGADMTLPARSAADAAEAMTELGKAGLSINNILGASKGVLQLSAAGNISNARAAEIAANALNAFGLEGTEATRVADLLAAAANASSLEITDAADAMQMSAAVFASAGVPIEDLITMISELGNAGIKGSDAGTSLKQMLLSLQAPSIKAKNIMRDMGLEVYDASGNMLSMREIIGNLQKTTSGMTQEQKDFTLATIFGSDAVRAANILLKQGVDGFDQMEGAVTKAGAAADLAAARNKGFTGSLDALKSAIQTVQISVGSKLLPVLTKLTRGAASAVNEIEPLSHLFAMGFNGGQIGGNFNKIERAVFTAGQTFRTVLRTVQEFADTIRRELLPDLAPLLPQLRELGNAFLDLIAASPKLMPLIRDFGDALLQIGRVGLPIVVKGLSLFVDLLTASLELLTRFTDGLTDSNGNVTKLGRAFEIVVGYVAGMWAIEAAIGAVGGAISTATGVAAALQKTMRGIIDVANPMAGRTRAAFLAIRSAAETAYIRVLLLRDAIVGFKDKTVKFVVDGLETAYLKVLEMRDTLARMANKTVTFTQNIVTTGAAFVGDFIDKTVTITQNVIRTGADWITDFADKTMHITQDITLGGDTTLTGNQNAVQDVGKRSGTWFGQGFLSGIGGFIGYGAAKVLATTLGGASILGVLGTVGATLGGALVAGLIPGIAAKLGGTNWGTVFNPIGTLTVMAIAGIFAGPEAVAPIAESLGNMFGRIIGATTGLVVTLFAGLAFTIVGTIAQTIFGPAAEPMERAGGFLIDKIHIGAQKAIPALLDFFTGLPSTIGTILQGIPGFFEELPGRIGNALAGIPGAFSATLTFIQGLPLLMSTATALMVGSFAELPGQIGAGLAALPGVVGGILQGVLGFFQALPGQIGGAIASIPGTVTGVFNSLPQPIQTAMSTIGTAVSVGWEAVRGSTVTVLGIIAGGVQDGWNNVNTLTGGALEEFRQSVAGKGGEVIDEVRTWPGRIVEGLGELGGLLVGTGGDIVQGLLDGITAGMSGVINYVFGIPGQINAQIPYPLDVLYSIGVSIMTGLLSGLQAGWNTVAGWVGQVAGFIKGLKGPIEDDRVLLEPEGQAIMQGLGAGLQQGFSQSVIPAVTAMAPSIYAAFQNTLAGPIESTRTFISELRDVIGSSAEQIASDFGKVGQMGGQALIDNINAFGAPFRSALADYLQAVVDHGDALVNELALVPPQLRTIALQMGISIADGLKASGPAIDSALTPFLTSVADAVARWGQGIVSQMTDTYKQALAISAQIAANAAGAGTGPVLTGASATATVTHVLTNSAPLRKPTATPSYSGTLTQADKDYIDQMNANNAFVSYAHGTSSVPRNMLANLHKGERVIPAAMNREGAFDGPRVVNIYHYGDKQDVYPNVKNTDDMMRVLGWAMQ